MSFALHDVHQFPSILLQSFHHLDFCNSLQIEIFLHDSKSTAQSIGSPRYDVSSGQFGRMACYIQRLVYRPDFLCWEKNQKREKWKLWEKEKKEGPKQSSNRDKNLQVLIHLATFMNEDSTERRLPNTCEYRNGVKCKPNKKSAPFISYLFHRGRRYQLVVSLNYLVGLFHLNSWVAQHEKKNETTVGHVYMPSSSELKTS